VTTLNPPSTKYDEGSAMKNFFDAAQKAGHNTGIFF
jgi:hypothetical protein